MSSNLPRILYFGLPLGVLALSRAGFRPAAVVLGHTDAPGGRRVRRMYEDAPLFERPELADPAFVDALAATRPDVLLSWFFPKRIPEAILRLAPRGGFGAHPSLLPRWRGPDPYFWAIYSGDRRTGVTLHRLDREYDTGAVVAQVELEIGECENAWRLAKRLDRPGLALLVSCAQRLADAEPLEGEPQDDALATEAPQPDEQLLSLDWERPRAELLRLIRAAAPYPGASAELGEALVEVVEARPYEGTLPRALLPSEAVWTPQGLVVCAGDGGLLLTRVRDETGEILPAEALRKLLGDELSEVGFIAPRSDDRTVR